MLNTIAEADEGTTKSTLAQQLAAKVADPDERDQKLRYLLDVLVGDGYITSTGRRYQFRSPLLRAFWLRRVKS